MPDIPTAIHSAHGYQLFKGADGVPFVIHKWTTYSPKDGISQCHEERLALVASQFERNQTAREVYLDLKHAWEEWQSWCQANAR